MTAINHELKEMIEKAATWETRASTFSLLESQLQMRREYAISFKRTGDKRILPQIDICNNNIKKLLGL